MFRYLGWLVLLIVGCQSAQKQSEELLRDRTEKLRPLSGWEPTWCEVEAELTAPAVARYRAMFPDLAEIPSRLAYTWKSRQTTCEITPLDGSPVAANYASFLESSLCLLMQVHFVNSPFDELGGELEPMKEGIAQIRSTRSNPDLGIFLTREIFRVETRTRKHGHLVATYEQNGAGPWLPKRLEQIQDGTQFAVEDIRYDLSGERPGLSGYAIAVGAESVIKQSEVTVRGCRAL